MFQRMEAAAVLGSYMCRLTPGIGAVTQDTVNDVCFSLRITDHSLSSYLKST